MLLSRLPHADGAAAAAAKDGESKGEEAPTDEEMRKVFSRPLLRAMTQEGDLAARLMAWAAALRLLAHAPPALVPRIAAHWKVEMLPPLLHAVIAALPLGAASVPALAHGGAAALCAASLSAAGGAAPPAVADLAACVYLELLERLPAVVRHWVAHGLPGRAASAALLKFTEAHCSPRLLRREVGAIGAAVGAEGDESFRVRGSAATRQITATYTCEGSAMQIVLTLPPCHPLRAVDVTCAQRVGVSDAKWRRWQRDISTMLLGQNGTISDALSLWKQNLDKLFEGVEECPICYVIVHPATRQLPKLECRTCAKKFHAACLYKWFNSGQKSTCPMCQATF